MKKKAAAQRPSYREIRIQSWRQFRDLLEEGTFRSWAFRGQPDASWPLFSSLSRHFMSRRIQPRFWPLLEQRILRVFRRKAHLFLDYVPREEDVFDWLAVMQNHGAPTRLLDFTWSPYVAAFFALNRATRDAAIWALFPPGATRDRSRTIRASQKDNPDEIAPWNPGHFEKYFAPNSRPLVVMGEPYVMSRRLTLQSGTFVIPGVLNQPVEVIVAAQSRRRDSIVKITLETAKVRRNALRELYSMNITHATLFPDIDGLARSLSFELEYHWAFDPVTGEKYEGFEVE